MEHLLMMDVDKLTKLFNILSEYKKDLTPEEEAAFNKKKIGRATRYVNNELDKKIHEWAQK